MRGAWVAGVAAPAEAAGAAAAGRSGWAGISGAGNGALPRAGVATAQGFIGVQPPLLLTLLSGGETTATVGGTPFTAPRTGGAVSAAPRNKRQARRFTTKAPSNRRLQKAAIT
jgi:hypothetical protein